MTTNENNPCTCTTPEYTIILNQQGPQGRQGATGQNGFSPIIAVGTNTRDTYNLVITTADGVITTPNLISEPIPSGGINGQVLTNFGNDVYGWGTLPNATTESQGVVYLSTDEDFQPDEEGNVDDSTACTPQSVVNYVNTRGLKPMENIKYVRDGILIDDGVPIPQTGTYYYKSIELRSVSSASQNDSTTLIRSIVNTYKDGTLERMDGENVINVSSGQFSIGDSHARLRLHSSVEIMAEVDLGVPKVVTTGLRYKTLTSTKYEALSTKDADTMYRLTDTNEVYLGSIKLTGGGNVVAGMYARTYAGGQNTGHVGTNTVSTYDPPTT